jgi:hypothetical protein
MPDLEPHNQKLQLIKEEIELQTLQRRAALEKVEDYISFITLKMGGAVLIVIGSIEMLAPGTIHGNLPRQSAGMLGIGFALLAGSKAARFLAKMLDTFQK